VRSVLIVAPEESLLSLPLEQPIKWPYYESNIDAQAVIAKLASFTPNVDATLTQITSRGTANAAIWRCPRGLTNHLAMIDVLSTASFLNDWNLRTGFIEFANPAAALGDLIFQMKQLAALALRHDEQLYIESRDPPLNA
ncbi:MAG: hypothetical protein PVF50_05805, partial [Gammaproteobacteria bacterium]|jgi:hypothetical protein